MRQNKKIRPPRWAERLLEWYCRPSLLEDLQGDLNEYFERHCQSVGPKRARLIYVLDVFKFLRIYTIRKPEFLNLLIHWIMIGSYFKTSGRSIVRNKLFSGINIFGLAISMSVGLLMIVFLSDLLSYDSFHEKHDRIYRVINDYHARRTDHMATTSLKASRRIHESVTGIEEMVTLRRGFAADVYTGSKIVPLEGLYSSPALFDVFSFRLLQGNESTALKDPHSLVLTESSAKKLFGDEVALGKSVKFYTREDTSEYVVTGVMEDIPKFSHMQFDGLLSYATYEARENHEGNFLDWDNMWNDYVYIVLNESTEKAHIQAQLDRISEEENKSLKNSRVTMSLQPLKDIALGPDLSNQIGPTMMVSVVWILGVLSFIVILSACFNYTNLSLARSIRRSREVGIRKVIGALRSHVRGQFLTESILVAGLSLILAFLLFLFIRPHFLSLAPELGRIVTLDLSAKVIGAFVVFAVVIGALAGFLPAVFYSRVNSIQVLKDASSLKVFRNVSMRKVLIVVQYTFSLIFITATIIGYKQYKHALAFDLGFNTENILNIDLQGNKAELLEKELMEFPEVQGISRSALVTSIGEFWGTQLIYKDDSISVYFNTVNEHYIPIHDHTLVAGRNFTAKAGVAPENEIIINETLLKQLNFPSAEAALGQIARVDDKDVEIVGVMRDFHYGKVDHRISSVILRYSNADARVLNVLVKSADWPATFERLEAVWKKFDTIHPLNATFYKEQIERAYNEFSVMIKLMGFLAFLAISIASIGLLGMVVFTTETRLREISIRKVLGASEANVVILLSRGFLALLLIAAMIALPLTYLFFDQVVLASIVYHAPVTVTELLISLLVVMGIALLMIGSQTLKVARSNPAEVLKSE